MAQLPFHRQYHLVCIREFIELIDGSRPQASNRARPLFPTTYFPMPIAQPEVDKALWFMHAGCTGRHYLLGNAHTVPGRVLAWCPKEQRSLFVSKGDMRQMARATGFWLAGFLHGAEPPPPSGEEGPPDFASKEYARWKRATARFRESGSWQVRRR